jgi:cobalt-precorrin-5B (C1)-methyltransferase
VTGAPRQTAPPALRTGFTTGACAAAAARAAARALVTGTTVREVEILLPNGEAARFTVARCERAGALVRCSVVKNGGDDPDVTHGAEIVAEVALSSTPGVRLLGGPGVAVVTRPGLGLDVGGPAINPVPRRNITEMVLAELDRSARGGATVTISVPSGEELAPLTLNPRLGLIGGISILGTTGVVRPFSTSAFRASVLQAIDVACSGGAEQLVFTTGGRSERFAMRLFPGLPEAVFVQVGDFVGAALRRAARRAARRATVAAMVGKLTKIAQGETITHANRAEVDTALLAELAASVGAPAEECAAIAEADTARFAAERMEALGLLHPFHTALARKVVSTLTAPDRYADRFQLHVLVCDFEGQKIAEASSP